MASQFLSDLIAKGYLPQEVPPWFVTHTLTPLLDVLRVHTTSQKTSKPCRFSIPTGTQARRVLAIPNPWHYIKLCEIISDNWSSIRGTINASPISLTVPTVRARSLRALARRYSYQEIAEKVIYSSTSSRYLLRTDISRYYSTIYTHTIPWALHGKDVAKAQRFSSTLLGNKIDKAIQSCQDGQTNGIPVGPDTSLLVSEILCSAMDGDVVQLGAKRAFRYIDDYFLFFDSLATAEKAHSGLRMILRGFELEPNPSKTRIIRLPAPLQPGWVSELAAGPEPKDLFSYISKAFDYAEKHPGEEVLKFGLARLRGLKMRKKDRELYVAFVLNVMMHEPAAIPLASEILAKLLLKGEELRLVADTVTQVLSSSAENGHEFEICWTLWLCAALDIPVAEVIAAKISCIDNPLVALTALYLKSKGLIGKGLDTTIWESHMVPGSLYDDHWLLAYEAQVKGWLPSQVGDYVSSDPFFGLLKKNNLSFFDTNALKGWVQQAPSQKWLYAELSPAF